MLKSVAHIFLDIRREDIPKTILLVFNFFLIIVTFYIVKPVRGALVVSKLGADSLPYIWTFTALTIGFFVAAYSHLVDRYERHVVYCYTTGFFVLSLIAIRYLLELQVAWLTGVFYVWGDLFSVVMVEQFWSFTNDVFQTKDAKRLYGIIGSGGILGGIVGSAITAFAVESMGTLNLIYICIGILLVLLATTLILHQLSLRTKNAQAVAVKDQPSPARIDDLGRSDLLSGFKLVAKNKYLLMIFSVVILTQVISNIIDFQFNSVVENTFSSMDAKTSFFGRFFMWMNIASLTIMLVFTSPIHRFMGILTGLLVLPMINLMTTAVFIMSPIPLMIFTLKMADKSIAYSVNRASKEMLWIPTSKDMKFKAKAVIDMFGYRFSKIIGSALILPFITFIEVQKLSYLNMALMVGMIGLLLSLFKTYNALETESQEATATLSPVPH